MTRASGIGHLKPFLPGLGALLEDPDVSEIMINGPDNVWVERAGKLEPHGFDRELARDGGEALEVPASLAEEYGLFPEDVGTEDEIRDAVQDPHGREEEDR